MTPEKLYEAVEVFDWPDRLFIFLGLAKNCVELIREDYAKIKFMKEGEDKIKAEADWLVNVNLIDYYTKQLINMMLRLQ